MKKVLIIHEWWASFGGSESVALRIHKAIPGSELICLSVLEKNDKAPKSIWVTKLIPTKSRPILSILSIFAFRVISLKEYDIVIASSHTFAHTAKLFNDSRTKYLSFVHTPLRSIWLPEIDNRFPKIFGSRIILRLLREIDMKCGRHVDSIATNSIEVKSRIKEFWGRDSIVIYPPIRNLLERRVEKPSQALPKKYLLSAGRLIEYKRHDFAIRLAADLSMDIVIMGAGPEENNLRMLAENIGCKVTFVIAPNDEEWNYVLRHSDFFLFPVFEDFGIIPVEALKVGVPVIALNKGGAREYIVHGTNGFLIDELNLNVWANFLRDYSFDKSIIIASAAKFDEESFDRQIREWVESIN